MRAQRQSSSLTPAQANSLANIVPQTGGADNSVNSQPTQIRKIDERLQQEEQMLEKFRLINWNNHRFAYIPLETSILHSLFTDENPSFSMCVALIEGYNREIEECKKRQQEINDGPWKNKFYGTLQNLCREVIFTKDDRVLQRRFAERVAEWAQLQMRKKDKRGRSDS